MKINKWIAGIFLAGFLLVFQSGIYAADMKKWSVGGTIGASETDLSNKSIDSIFLGSGFATTTTFSDTESAWNIFLANRLSPNLGVEVGYYSFGDFGYSGAVTAPTPGTYAGSIEITAYYGAIVGFFPLNERFELFGKFGMAFWDQEGSISNATMQNAEFVNGSNGKDRLFAFGGDFKLTDRIIIRGDLTLLKRNVNTNVWSIGAFYKF